MPKLYTLLLEILNESNSSNFPFKLVKNNIYMGYRGNKYLPPSLHIGKNYLATEGVGLYITPDKNLAKQFGDLQKIYFYHPKKIVKANVLPILYIDFEDNINYILDSINKNDDNWILAHKIAAKKLNIKNENDVMNSIKEGKLQEMLTVVLKHMHYDAVLVSNDDVWMVILDNNLVIKTIK